MAKAKRQWVLKATVFSALRKAWRNCPARRTVLAEAKEEYFVKCKNGNSKRRVHFRCACCGEYVDGKYVNVDHIDPVIDPTTGFTTYDEYIKRLFCPEENLQVLCDTCHDIKTAKEGKVRAKTRKRAKESKEATTGKTKQPKVASRKKTVQTKTRKAKGTK